MPYHISFYSTAYCNANDLYKSLFIDYVSYLISQDYIANVDIKKLRRIINHFFADAKTNWHLKDRLNGTVMDIYTSDVITNPKQQINKICFFLQLPCSQQYINDTASIIHIFKSKTRHYIHWPSNLIKMVAKRMQCYPFLSKFTYES